jgi:hypothetical protein
VALQVIGAGLGRTGTLSLKLALERLLDGRCYHMVELFHQPGAVQVWDRALDGHAPDWDQVFAGYNAGVDWITAAFLPELAEAYPDAIVLLSLRDVDEWWRSFNDTVVETLRNQADSEDNRIGKALEPTRQLTTKLLSTRFTSQWADEATAKEAFSRHNAAVRAAISPGRLVEWRPGDGWKPICAALGRPPPAAPFPHANTTADFRAGSILDAAN